jgi:hypothetical protein
VQVHCSEGVAIRAVPEPCGSVRESVAEASAGVRAGQPLSHEMIFVPVPKSKTDQEGQGREVEIARGSQPESIRPCPNAPARSGRSSSGCARPASRAGRSSASVIISRVRKRIQVFRDIKIYGYAMVIHEPEGGVFPLLGPEEAGAQGSVCRGSVGRDSWFDSRPSF